MEESVTKVKNALIWIKAILEEEGIPYQIVGGLAARIYGAKRAIADIDMYIPREYIQIILGRVEDYITKPFKHYHEEDWDIEYFQLKYKNQKIEIALSPGGKFFDKKQSKWIEQRIDFSKSLIVEFEGILITVMPRDDIITYKLQLNSEVDLLDINEIK